MAASARSRLGAMASGFVGKISCGISMASSKRSMDRPISPCCGSSFSPGWPRQVTTRSVGIRNVQLSEVSGLTRLPRPEFWHMTTVFRPPSQAPAAMPAASPSLAAPTYRVFSPLMA